MMIYPIRIRNGMRDDFVEDGQMPEFIPSAAMQAFSEFINAQSLNQRQINFVHKIINHMEQNGYMENVAVLAEASV